MHPETMTNDSDRVAPDRRVHLPSPTHVRSRRRIAAGVLSLLLGLSCLAASPAWAYKAGYGADDMLSSIKEYDNVPAYLADTTRNSYLYVKIKYSGKQYTLKQNEVEAFHKANTLTPTNLIEQYANPAAYTNDNSPQRATRLYADIGDKVYRVTELEEARGNVPSGGSIVLPDPVDSLVEDIDIFGTTAVGRDASATGYRATAIGTNASATDRNAIAIGSGASATGYGAAAIGTNTSATGNRSVAIGSGARTTATSQGAIAIGMESHADGWKPVAIGAHAQAYGNTAIAVGRSVQAHGDGAIALGAYADARGGNVLSLGNGAKALVGGAMAVGGGSRATGERSTALGSTAKAGGLRSTAVGQDSQAQGTDTVAVGRDAEAGGLKVDKTYDDVAKYLEDTTRTTHANVRIGSNVYQVNALEAVTILTKDNLPTSMTVTAGGVAVGVGTRAAGVNSIALGWDAEATGTDNIALGRGARASGTNAIAIGPGVSAAQNEVVIGTDDHTYELPGLGKHPSGTRVVTVDSEGRLSTQAATSSSSRSASLRGAAALSSEATSLNRDMETRTDAADYEEAPAIGSGPTAPETADRRRVVVQDTNRDGSVRLRTLDFSDLSGMDRRLDGVEQRVSSLSDRLNKATAMSAALSALPNVVPGDNRFFLGVGAGHYSSEQALAVGMSARVGRHVFVNAGAALASGDDASVRGGVGVVW